MEENRQRKKHGKGQTDRRGKNWKSTARIDTHVQSMRAVRKCVTNGLRGADRARAVHDEFRSFVCSPPLFSLAGRVRRRNKDSNVIPSSSGGRTGWGTKVATARVGNTRNEKSNACIIHAELKSERKVLSGGKEIINK